MSIYHSNFDNDFINVVNSIFEADDVEKTEAPELSNEPVDDEPVNNNIEISPPPEESIIKNSDTFIENKVLNSYIDNDPAIHNLIQIMTSDMLDQDKIKSYVEVFFTKLGINDVEPSKFGTLSSEIWNKLEELTEVDPKASLAEFTSWAHEKIGQYNR